MLPQDPISPPPQDPIFPPQEFELNSTSSYICPRAQNPVCFLVELYVLRWYTPCFYSLIFFFGEKKKMFVMHKKKIVLVYPEV